MCAALWPPAHNLSSRRASQDGGVVPHRVHTPKARVQLPRLLPSMMAYHSQEVQVETHIAGRSCDVRRHHRLRLHNPSTSANPGGRYAITTQYWRHCPLPFCDPRHPAQPETKTRSVNQSATALPVGSASPQRHACTGFPSTGHHASEIPPAAAGNTRVTGTRTTT